MRVLVKCRLLLVQRPLPGLITARSTVKSYASDARRNIKSRKQEDLMYQMSRVVRSSRLKNITNDGLKDLSAFMDKCNEANHVGTFDGSFLPSGFGNNQNIDIDPHIEKELQLILSDFHAPIDFAFGYGSGVFQQNGYDNKGPNRPQIDLIMGVLDPIKFHEVNIKQNPKHYSLLRWCGPKVLSRCEDLGAGIYFNPFVTIRGHEVKYGVVSIDRLVRDLSTWDSFYLAGRLQKPVKILKENSMVKYWNQLNLKSAATLAKHLLRRDNTQSPKIDEFDFYRKITGLSYLGDIRYTLGGENPNKVNNIVARNLHNFQKYYEPIYEDVIFHDNDYLPPGYNLNNSLTLLERHIRRTSILQTLKGIFTAGATKSLKYAWNKKMKAWKAK